jgi:hypothetical protein
MKSVIQKTAVKGRAAAPKGRFMSPKNSRKDSEEFGPGKAGIIFCKVCDIVYFNKSWSHNLRNYNFTEKDRKLRFAVCPACAMKKERRYEGEIRIAGMPKVEVQKTITLAEALARKAYEINPLARILKTVYSRELLSIFTSQNQLTQRLAKKMKETNKKLFSAPKIHKSEGGDAFIVMMEYLK